MPVGGRGRRSLWVLAGDGEADLMTLSDGDGGEALPVFGFEEEARMYLQLLGKRGEWKVREAEVGELARLLRGPYAGVGRVALDPVPAGVNSSGPLDVAWPSREGFLGSFRAPSHD
ncbi:hypothetical protein GBA65_02695 [Rubrobacter marinus]|uniref:SseB protein N-terminal domain-containing protein n=1 Tax=Rubrobacter marinus TaxID=2653852 RepID=A0A6G8PTS3_9ACTN|nr:hypothetical protein [Rubrobacter marinus]QIN77597.1 hypothetical protein GBA65_02695 [Rubrobacter marinus]